MNAARITIHRYAPDMAAEWNDFVARSKNGTFLFDRRYMDYHAGRVADASVIFRCAGRLAAVMPGNIEGDMFNSHARLTYGGLVNDVRLMSKRPWR